MFKKVLVVEDIDSISVGIATLLDKMGIENVVHCQYCDDALVKFKKAHFDKNPFELVICDLSFKKSHREDVIKNGEELIPMLAVSQPDLKIIVFSIEDHPKKVRELWDTGLIHGYVDKNRWGLKNLEKAIEHALNNTKFLSPTIKQHVLKRNMFKITSFESTLLKLLSTGHSQDEIQAHFIAKGISPNSRSSIEKKLKELRDQFNAKTTIHLVMIAKSLRLI